MAPLPFAERDPVRRLQRVSEIMQTQALNQHRGAGCSNRSATVSTGLFARIAGSAPGRSPCNLVTNVPGPQFPVYMLGPARGVRWCRCSVIRDWASPVQL
jgi:hypothetical protein